MSDDRILKMTEQIGELNGTVRGMNDTIERFMLENQQMHRDHYQATQNNKIGIERINARHATYWKIIGSCGGLAAMFTAWLKGIAH